MDALPKNNGTKVLVFRTSIKQKKDIKIVKLVFNEIDGIKQWNIDVQDIDNVLRIEATNVRPGEIMRMIRSVGYTCEELAD